MGCRQSKIIDETASISAGSVQTVLRPRHQRRKHQIRWAKQASSCSGSRRVDTRVSAKYAVKAVIAKGRFSRVLRVENRLSKQPYAIKVIETRDGSHVETELAVLRRVRHPNVVRLDEVFCVGCRVYMVMELATGGNLLDKVEMCAPFVEADAARVIGMVACGLAHLHDLGIAHRNLQPENVLYAHPGAGAKVMIADFGEACAPRSGREAHMHTVCGGALHYTAPELVARRPYTRAVDMWALGVIACFLLTGALPFDADNDADLVRLILRAQLPTAERGWEHVSPEAKCVARRLLQRNPVQRLTAAELLRHPWVAAMVTTAGTAHRPAQLRLQRRGGEE
ncbi:serine/threonine-protein kinase H1 homolog [Dermacentor silvarum]|uniref:serine/threonine-protein kinase H1 homolog n=1 Tax=Dermacentor silvarum TaxID=543639 RepID=UPI00189C0CEA|nr:serine/threonine-protein kinase H1 homolog [Dermacentor silvarum]